MSLGYTLPGTTIVDNTTPSSVTSTSTQRKPCLIGLASSYVSVSKEAVTRGTSSSDALAYSSEGIYNITAVGSNSGMNNYKENTHWQLVDNNISWLPKVQYAESAIISSIVTPINYNVSIENVVAGVNSTSGYATITTSPNAIVSTAACGIPVGTYQLRCSVDGGSANTASIVLSTGTETWQDLVSKIVFAGTTASISNGKIVITASSTGTASSVVITDGGTNGLLAAMSRIGTYSPVIGTSVQGTAATAGYNIVSYDQYMNSSVMHNIAAGTYNIKLTVDGASTATSYSLTVEDSGTYDDIIAAINNQVDAVTATISSGKIIVTSNTFGAVSSVVVGVADTNDIFTAIATANSNAMGAKDISTRVSGTAATMGTQTFYSSTTKFSPNAASRISAGSYYLNMSANGSSTVNSYVITLSGSETWNQVISILSNSVASVAVLSINSSGVITFTSKISGSNSAISISDGSTAGFITAISAVTGTYVTGTPVSTAGVASTAAYQEISSTPATFKSTAYCNLPSGQYYINVAVDGASTPTPVLIQVSSETETWGDIVSSMSVSGASIAIVNEKIRFTSHTKGAAGSNISISDGSTNPIINKLDNISADNITVKVPALSYVRSANETNIEYISGSTTYTYTIKTDIADAQTTLKLYGSLAALKALSAGSVLNLTTVGSWLATGAKYYVSYNYNRPDSDYNVYKEYQNYNDVKTDLGADIPSNPIVGLCKLALQSYGVPCVAVVQIKSATKSNFLNALDVIKYKDVQTVLPISTDADVRSYVISHVTERSLPDSKRYRTAFLGASAQTPVGDEDTSNSLRGIASTIKNKRVSFVNATRGLYYYNDSTGTEQSAIVDGSFIACAVGLYHDSFSDPTTTLLNKSIPGIDLLSEDYDDYYNEYQLTQAGSSSCFLLTPSSAGGMLVIDDLTTDNTTVETSNINIVAVEDYIASDVIVQMNKFHGKLIRDKSKYASDIQKYLSKMFSEYQRNGIIASIGYTTAKASGTRGDTILIGYGYYSVYTHKYTEGTYELLA